MDARSALLRAIFAYDRLRFAAFRARFGGALRVAARVSPNLRFAELRLEPGATVEIGAGFATERRRGNRIWVQSNGRLALGPDVWLRTEHAANQLTVFPGGEIVLAAGAFLNGAMLHAKRRIEIGERSMLGFGSRVFDADLHDLDSETRERIEPVRIGARCWIGANVHVLRGVTIGDDVVVGAGSVVTRDLPSRVLAAGVPARVIRPIASREGTR
jgi:acetyltransferase-like isoleucine patch superfamily enzyme